MLTEVNTPKPKVKRLPTPKAKKSLDVWVVVLTHITLISQVEEVAAEENEPNCRLVQPFVITDSQALTMEPYLIEYTQDTTFMIHSDKIVTLAKPNLEILVKYESLVNE